MRANVWWAAFAFAVIFHIAGLAVAGQGILGEIALEPQMEYMEVELAAAPPAPKLAQPQAPPQTQSAPAVAERQSSSIINNVAESVTAPVTNPFFPVSEDRNAAPAAVTDASGSGTGPVAATNGGFGDVTGIGVAGTGGSGSAAAAAPPSAEQEVDSQPYVIDAPLPEYPSEARLNKWQGRVIVRVLVEASGRVADAQVAKSSGYNELDQAAEEVLYRWRFNPAYRDGQPVTAWVKVPVSFKLTR